jgi:signal transduction histidine kinase
MRRLFAFDEDDLQLLNKEWEFFFDRVSVCEDVVRSFFVSKSVMLREGSVDLLTKGTLEAFRNAFISPSLINKSAKVRAWYASKIGFNEIMCKELGYAATDVYCNGLSKDINLVARKTFGKLIAEFERGIYEIARRKSEKGIAILDRKTFDAYSEVLAHNVSNAIATINTYQTTLAKLIIKGKFEDAQRFVDNSKQKQSESFRRIAKLMEQNRRMATPAIGVTIGSMTFLIERVIRDLLMSKAKIVANYYFTDTDIVIKGDDLSFIRAIYPVCVNAIDAGADWIEISVSADRKENLARVTIANNGAPISEKDAKRLFAPFFGRRDRLGYGLSYAKRHTETMSLLELDPPAFELNFRLL